MTRADMSIRSTPDWSSGRVAIFEALRDRVEGVLQHFGTPDSLTRDGDYTVQGDYLGSAEVVAFVGNLDLLRPEIVDQLRQIVREFSGWQIVMTVAVRGHYDDWPNMGLYIRADEIIDGLQRQYFPPEFQSLKYERGRRGTAYD
jgi:hypothetical protein